MSSHAESEFGAEKDFWERKINLETKKEFGDSVKSDPNIFQIAETTWIC